MSVSQSEFDKIMEGLAMERPEEKADSGVLWFCKNCGIEPSKDNTEFIVKLFKGDTGTRLCKHFTEAVSLPWQIHDYVVNDIYNKVFTKKSVDGFFKRAAGTFKAVTELDDTIKNYLEELPMTEINRMINLNIRTWEDFVANKDCIGSNAISVVTDYELEHIGNSECVNPILSCDNLQYVGESKNNFQSIICQVICVSTLRKDELKKHLSEVRKIVMEKLGKEKLFKDNPELLKHIKISNMYYNGHGILRVHLEWKESFAYDHLK